MPKCWDTKKDCFAIGLNGYCTILSKTKFKDKKCPFYKPDSEIDRKEIRKAIKAYSILKGEEEEEENEEDDAM